ALWVAGTVAQTPRPPTRTVQVSALFEPLSERSIVFDETDWRALHGTPMTSAEAPFLDIYLLNRSVPPALEPAVNAWFEARQRALVEATEREAIAGARLIVWSEANGVTLARHERSFVDRVRDVARRRRVVVVMTLNVKDVGVRLSDNKALIIDANGEVLATYSKAHPVPGAEATRAGDGVVPVVATAVGRLALVICFDADHPELVRQAARGRADLLVVPGNDWRDITPYHTAMAAWRARELGLPMVRAASSGESAVFDSDGHVVTRQRTVARGDSPMRALAPVGMRGTLYGRTGDALTAAAALVGLAIAAAHRRTRQARA
ncbi:MAG: nitrilase-related carbon-nitrogen hydrolase, partial [Polyangiales bacterium]